MRNPHYSSYVLSRFLLGSVKLRRTSRACKPFSQRALTALHSKLNRAPSAPALRLVQDVVLELGGSLACVECKKNLLTTANPQATNCFALHLILQTAERWEGGRAAPSLCKTWAMMSTFNCLLWFCLDVIGMSLCFLKWWQVGRWTPKKCCFAYRCKSHGTLLLLDRNQMLCWGLGVCMPIFSASRPVIGVEEHLIGK